MAYASVGDAKHSANNSNVKTVSGNVERRRWWRKTEPQAPVVERSTFPNPGGDTQILPQAPGARPKPPAPAKPQAFYRERPGDIDRAGYNLMGLLALGGREKWSAGRLLEEIDEPLTIIRRIKAQEDADGQKLLDRQHAAAAAVDTALSGVRSVVANEEAANRLPGVTVNAVIDTGALGSELTAVTANAHSLSDATMTFQPITADMADPRVRVSVATVTVDGPASPVHVPGDGTHAPLPDDDDETADPGAHGPHATALPKRVPHPVHVMPAPMSDGENPQPIGLRPKMPAYNEVHGGDWVFDDSADAAVLKLVKQVTVVLGGNGDPVSARVFFEDGSDRRVRGDRTVRVLGTADAAALLEQYGAQVAQLEAAS